MTRSDLTPGAAMARVMAAPAGPAPAGPGASQTAVAAGSVRSDRVDPIGRQRASQTAVRPVVSDPPTRLVDPADLVSGSDVADRLRVSRAAVSQWAADPATGFPDPVARPGNRPVWLWTDVAAWARHRTVTTVRVVTRRTVTR